MKRVLHDSIFAMSNVVGNKVKIDKLPFSFFFSTKDGVDHDIRVKVIFDPSSFDPAGAGSLKLCDDWSFDYPSKHISASKLHLMYKFFHKYIVLFCIVWEKQLDPNTLIDYFYNRTTLEDLIKELSFYNENKTLLDNVQSVKELEQVCRKHNLTNLHHN